ncbi:MAG TPA: MtnX-like HAD-IB family phosphatase [Tissierellaceae bacterium]|nr:MtnX-like HAD-IB family phosphatase [Tissierellaceae bacterium]
MSKIKELSNVIILSDFDGTVTTFDTNIRLYEIYGNKEMIAKNREKYHRGEIDLRALYNENFSGLGITKEEYLDYMLREIKLQKGFKTFYNNLKKNNIPFQIVSGGFMTGIEPFLAKHNLEEITVHANRLIFNNRNIKVEHYEDKHFPHLINKDDYVDFKLQVLRNYKKVYDKVIFLGDGTTDINVANSSDYLFAKDYLKEYCIENDIDYIDWEDFYDVNKWFRF